MNLVTANRAAAPGGSATTQGRPARWAVAGLVVAVVLTVAAQLATAPLWAAEPNGKPGDKRYEQTVEKAIDYLRTKGQAADGSFSPQVGPAVTAIVVRAML